jgi:hypothetical protein
MDSGASNGDIFHGPTAANLFNRFLEDRAMATFFIVQGRQAFNSSKTGGQKELKEPYFGQYADAAPVSLVANQIA